MKEDGDCYLVAGRFVAFDDDAPRNAVLCHGTCTGHGPIAGIAFGHAWVEHHDAYTDEIFVTERSNGNNGLWPRSTFYKVGECRDVTRYTRDEARQMMNTHGHYGPWHTTTENT